MKSLLMISFKNVLKSRERVILTFLILTFGTMFYVSMVSLLNGLLSGSLNDTHAEETADIRIRAKNFDEEKPSSEDNYMPASETALRDGGYIYSPRLLVAAEADNYQDTLPVILIGVDPEKDSQVFTVKKSTSDNLGSGMVWVGSSLATDLKLAEGDYINLTFRTLEGAYISGEYSIGALVASTTPMYSENAVFVDIAELNTLLKTNVVTYYNIRLAKLETLQDDAAKIKNLYPDRSVLTWEELTKEIWDSMIVRKQFMDVFIMLIMLITLVGLINTILISVWEKRKTTGTLRALGYNNREIMMLFIFEGAWIGFIGALIGVFLGMLLNIPLSTIGIEIGAMMKIEGQSMNVGYTVPPVVRSTWTLESLITPLIIIPIAAMLVSIYPARKSVKMSIVDCLRNKD